MIPEFDENGKLPLGIHVAHLEEFERRFVINFPRKLIFNDLVNVLKGFQSIDCYEFYIDVSYVTTEKEPKDIDICWGSERISDEVFLQSLFNKNKHFILSLLEKKVGKCDIHPAYFVETDTKRLFIDFFQIDKVTNKPKGIIKLILKS